MATRTPTDLALMTGRTRRQVDPEPIADPFLVGLLVLAACEPVHTPLRWITDEPSARWWYLLPVWICALFVGLADGRGLRGASRVPARWLLAAAVWMMLVSPLGLVPHLDLATSTGIAAFVLAGAAVVETGGWPKMRAALFPASSILLVASALTEISGIGGSRWIGVFRDANALAFACVIAVVAGLDRWMRGRGTAGLLLAVSSLPVLVLTDGRIAMASLVVALLALVRPALPRWVVPGIVLVTVVGVLFLLTDESLGERASRTISRSGDVEEIATFTGRTVIWEVALEHIEERPVTGVGAASTPEVFVRERLDGRIDYFEVVHGHDLWVQLALSGGVPAVALVAIGAIGYARRAWRRPVRDRDALMLALLVHGLTEDVVAEPRYTLLIAAAAFASVAARPRRPLSSGDAEALSGGQATQIA